MTKETKPKEEVREPKPKYRSVIPTDFKIRRSPSPMVDILREAERPIDESRSPQERHTTQKSHSPHIADAVPEERHSPEESHSTQKSHSTAKRQTLGQLARSTQFGVGHSRTIHEFFDEIICHLHPHAQLLWLHLNRYREGGSEVTIILNWPRLAKRTKLGRTTLWRAAKLLSDEELAEQIEREIGKGKDQGFRFRLFTPESHSTEKRHTPAEWHSTEKAIKERSKENNKRELSRCDKCEAMNGFYFRDPDDHSKGVVKCTHS